MIILSFCLLQAVLVRKSFIGGLHGVYSLHGLGTVWTGGSKGFQKGFRARSIKLNDNRPSPTHVFVDTSCLAETSHRE